MKADVVLVRREREGDIPAVESVVEAAFLKRGSDRPSESRLLDDLRKDPGWIPQLSLVAVVDGRICGQVVCTRGWVDEAPALGLGPLAVLPESQGTGVGSALMYAALAAAEALDESLVALLGSPEFYARFGFEPARYHGIEAPVPDWAEHFQVRWLTAQPGQIAGTFRYARPFDDL